MGVRVQAFYVQLAEHELGAFGDFQVHIYDLRSVVERAHRFRGYRDIAIPPQHLFHLVDGRHKLLPVGRRSLGESRGVVHVRDGKMVAFQVDRTEPPHGSFVDPGRNNHRGAARVGHLYTRKRDGQTAQFLIERPDVIIQQTPKVALAEILTDGHLRHGGLQRTIRNRRIALEANRGDFRQVGWPANNGHLASMQVGLRLHDDLFRVIRFPKHGFNGPLVVSHSVLVIRHLPVDERIGGFELLP